jgi:hypothetical protein
MHDLPPSEHVQYVDVRYSDESSIAQENLFLSIKFMVFFCITEGISKEDLIKYMTQVVEYYYMRHENSTVRNSKNERDQDGVNS